MKYFIAYQYEYWTNRYVNGIKDIIIEIDNDINSQKDLKTILKEKIN